jgi:hypothetical protein
LKIVVAGETFDYDGAKQPMSEALWIEHVYKRRYAEWQSDLEAGSVKALAMLACLIWRRDGRDVSTSFADILDGTLDFDLNEMLQSMADAAEAEKKAREAAEKAEKGAANPTPASSAPAGSRGTRKNTKGSSAST